MGEPEEKKWSRKKGKGFIRFKPVGETAPKYSIGGTTLRGGSAGAARTLFSQEARGEKTVVPNTKTQKELAGRLRR